MDVIYDIFSRSIDKEMSLAFVRTYMIKIIQDSDLENKQQLLEEVEKFVPGKTFELLTSANNKKK